MTCEDLSLETELELDDLRAVVFTKNLAASEADRVALSDAMTRATRHCSAKSVEAAELDDLAAIAKAHGCTQIVTGFATVGPTHDALEQLRPALADQGIALTEHLRRWDRLAWPHCAKGFFQLKSRIPALLKDQAIR